jgi:phage-related protein
VVKNIIGTAWDWVTSKISGALNAAHAVVQNVWNKITSFISGALNKIKSLASSAWSAMGSVGSGILDGLKRAANVVIGAVNTVIDGLNWMIGVANQLPGPDIPKIPKIPRLAAGGVVSPVGGGTLAMIAEAGRPERVEPLDAEGLSKRDRIILDRISAGDGGDTFVTVKIGETELRGIVSTEVKRSNDDLAGALATGRKGR